MTFKDHMRSRGCVRCLSLAFVLMMVLACTNPVAATGTTTTSTTTPIQETSDQTLDRGVVVQDENGTLYALLTSSKNPAPWFSWVKPYDTVKIRHDENGKTYAILIKPPSPPSWPIPGANAQVAETVAAADIVAVYLIPGVGDVALLVTGAVVVIATEYCLATPDDPNCVAIKKSIADGTASFVRWGSAALECAFDPKCVESKIKQAQTSVQAWFSRVMDDLRQKHADVKREYNDAKDKGIPTKDYDPNNVSQDPKEQGETVALIRSDSMTKLETPNLNTSQRYTIKSLDTLSFSGLFQDSLASSCFALLANFTRYDGDISIQYRPL